MISSEKSGVWILDDAYHKDNAGYWNYSDPSLAGLYQFGTRYLNDPNAPRYSSPVQIPGTWSTNGHETGVKTDGTLWTWGSNSNGSLGQNNQVDYSSPVQIPGTQWEGGSLNDQAGFFTKTDGSLWMTGDWQGIAGWANNRRSSPVNVGGNNWDWKGITHSRNSGHFVAVRTDGYLYSWGYAYYGYLGLNQRYTSSPFGPQDPTNGRVGSDTSWRQGRAVYRGGLAIKTNNTLWAWGGSSVGTRVIPWNSGVNYSSPVQIPGTTWNKIGGQYDTPLATKTDGTLWAWGANNNGAIGNNVSTGINYSSPIQIPGTTWDQPINSDISMANGCFKTDGTLWLWGRNTNGELGQIDTAHRSSPTQVPGTTWDTNNYQSTRYRLLGT